ncbi:MAG: hypothetical protein H0T42_12445 [Deltaproteobacteria bacterium]|nr:hypothetical protein [Deltaproteobacteria bacterium]
MDRALRERAKAEGKSLNEVAIEALSRALNIEQTSVRRRDLGGIAGSWIHDRKVDEALEQQRSIDPEVWD